MLNLRVVDDKDERRYLEQGGLKRWEVFLRSKIDPSNEYSEDSLDGMGYCAIEKMYPGQDIEGYSQIGETLYIVKKGPFIPF